MLSLVFIVVVDDNAVVVENVESCCNLHIKNRVFSKCAVVALLNFSVLWILPVCHFVVDGKFQFELIEVQKDPPI